MSRVLIACEESQEVTKAFRARGHEAYSCDLLPCSGGEIAWHLQMDARVAIARTPFLVVGGSGMLMEFDGPDWDLIILHPPCTKVAVSGNGTYAGTQERIDAANWNADLFFLAKKYAKAVAMEQPVTVLPTLRPDLPKPHYVDLWWFGTKQCKKTAWYLHNLPPLKMTNNVGPPPTGKERAKWMDIWMMGPGPQRATMRSKLDPNLAKAMSEQWG